MKRDLLNSVEMLLSAEIISAQEYTKLVQKISLFNEALPKLEASRGTNKEAKEFCACGSGLKKRYCIDCYESAIETNAY